MGDELKAGVGTLASMSEAPVLPVYVAGSNTLFSWPEALSDTPWLAIRVGSAIRPGPERGRAGREEAARRLSQALADLEREHLASKGGACAAP